MTIIRTDKDTLEPADIIKYIEEYEKKTVPLLNDLWSYYLGKNVKILNKRVVDYTNPDNRTPVSYGRKIITTFTGYAYRPGYITYKSEDEAMLTQLQAVFDKNNEKIKTSLHGRNTGIFGMSYELMYMDGENGRADIRFSVIDPREFILLYDYSIEAQKKIGIRFYPVDDENWKVAVYYSNYTEFYDLKRSRDKSSSKLNFVTSEETFFGELPIVAYYLGQEIQGLIEPVIPLIDDYDELVSGSIDEFSRFANAYLLLVKMSLDPAQAKALKTKRVFEQLADSNAVKFLTKDIPSEYIQFMTGLIRDQIHIQSHVPDLGSGAFADGISGVAVDRLMFDFENVVSNAEAEFDTALYNRIKMIFYVLKLQSASDGTFDQITIVHKRNKPANTKEYSEIALNMKNAGFSDYAIADYMPDEMIPDTEKELERQEEEQQMAIPDVETIAADDTVDEQPEEDDNGGR